MSSLAFIFCVGFLIVGLGSLLAVSWLHRLGNFAKSPQVAELTLGTRVIAAGGRAMLWFAAVDMGPQVEVSCKKETRMLELFLDEPSDPVCGVQVKLLELKEQKMGK